VPCLHIGLGINPNHICGGSVGNPHLASIQNVFVTLLLSLQLHAGNIRATVRFAHRQCSHEIARAQARQVFSLLSIACIQLKLIDTEVAMSKVTQTKGGVGLAELLHNEAVLVVSEAETSILLTCSDPK
jgi:hypothetical protein